MFKKFVATAAVAAGLAWASPASASDNFLFDITGAGAQTGFVEATSFDWNVGNAIAVGVNALSPVGTTFQLYYQANLSVVNLAGGADPLINGGGFGSNTADGIISSITVVIGFQEQVVSKDALTGEIKFAFVNGGTNFFQIYANDVRGDDLSGACFVCGTQIMSGTVLPFGFTSGFTVGDTSGTAALDQRGTNNYAGVTTMTGSGNVNLTGQITSYSTSYFQALPGNFLNFAFANSVTKLAYQETDPSACFFAATSTGGLSPTCTDSVANLTGVTPFTGVGSVGVNGLTGRNTMFQADANTSFSGVGPVPEPASLTLLGLGLVGTAAARRRMKKNGSQQ